MAPPELCPTLPPALRKQCWRLGRSSQSKCGRAPPAAHWGDPWRGGAFIPPPLCPPISFIASFSPAVCSKKFLIRRIHSLPVSAWAGGTAAEGSELGGEQCNPGGGGVEQCNPGGATQRCFTSPPPNSAPQPRLLGSSPALRDVSNCSTFSSPRGGGQRRDDVSGAAGGAGGGRGLLESRAPPHNPHSFPYRRGACLRSRRGRGIAAGCR